MLPDRRREEAPPAEDAPGEANSSGTFRRAAKLVSSGPSRQLTVARQAMDVVLRALAALPPSNEARELHATAEARSRELDGWRTTPATAEECSRVMAKVLELHADVARLARERPAR